MIVVPTIIVIQNIAIGRVIGIQHQHNEINEAKKGSEVAIKIEQAKNTVPPILFGRQFDASNELVSLVS